MFGWPKSLPDYQWPRAATSWRSLPRRWCGAAAFHACHLAGRVVRRLFRHEPAVLVIRTDGIGDAVLAEPMIGSLARLYAGHEKHLWAPAETCELLRAAPWADCLTPLPRGRKDGNLSVLQSPGLRARLGYRLGRRKFQAVFYIAHSPEPLGNWLLASARAKQRWYAPGNLENQFAAQRAATVAAATTLLELPPAGAGHDLVRNARLALQWGADIRTVMPTVHLDEEAYAAAGPQAGAWRKTAAWMRADGIIGLMPAASLTVKEYPAASWTAVAQALWHQRRMVCALLGGPQDQAAMEQVASEFGRLPHLKMVGPLDLPAMAALLGALDGLMTVDTGLAHISLAEDVPTVVLVGGGHPGRFFPWPLTRRAAVLTHAMPCAGCSCKCHLSQAKCVTGIEPAEIVAGLFGLLDRPKRLPLRAVG
jgi:ADP-heptose:LPS heptosyltransferase